MKKGWNILLAALLLLSGCGRGMEDVIQKEPNFGAVVVSAGEQSILVLVDEGEEERRSSDLISVSLDVREPDSMSRFDVGDAVRVYYDGSIAESYPAQITTVYAITLTGAAKPEEVLTARLEEAGFSVRQQEEKAEFFTERCLRLTLGDSPGAQVVLYPFPDREETDRAAEQIGFGGTELPASGGGVCEVDWVDTPHFYRYGSDIVQYIGSDETVLAVLEAVCSETLAGAQ